MVSGKEKRAQRRERTRRRIKARVRQWREIDRGSSGKEPKAILQPGRLAKLSPWHCNCRKRSRGAPHVGGGICHIHVVSPTFLERREGRRQCREWVRLSDPEGILDMDPEARRPWIERTW